MTKKMSYITAFGLSSTEKGINNNLAERQIQGAYFRANRIGEEAKDESTVREKLAGILPTGPNSLQNELMVEAVMNEHCYAKGVGESSSVEKAIKKTIGELFEYNDKKILLPSRMAELNTPGYITTKGSFDNLLTDWSKRQENKTILVGGVVIQPQELEFLVKGSQLQSVSDGKYRVINGLYYLTDKNGMPITIDLNPIIEGRKK